jgi:maleate isomerase
MSDIRRDEVSRYPLWHSWQGWRARIGVIYPGAGFHHLGDFFKLRPRGVAVGGTGVPRHRNESVQAMLELDRRVVDAARLLAAHEPDVIVWMCTAGSFLKGKGHDERIIREMEEATGIPCTTTSTAVMEAFRELSGTRIALVTPYPDEVNEIEREFLEANGFRVVAAEGLNLTDNNILAHLSASVLYRVAKEVTPPEADIVFISCTGLDVLDIVEALEQDLGKPVVTSNQASYWLAFRMAGVGDAVEGYGELLRRPWSRGSGRRLRGWSKLRERELERADIGR